MRYIEFLRGVHERLAPPTYLEIGIRDGKSLSLSHTRSIGVDPAFEIRRELDAPVSLHRTTSDDFFAQPDRLELFAGEPAALAFIDGMHLFEYALRDFVNVEHHAAWTSVIVFDDMFPRYVEEAARDRITGPWTGDVFRTWQVLREYRPDLVLVPVDTMPTGLLLVLGADPDDTRLAAAVTEAVERFVADDPQDVPAELLDRHEICDPQLVLDSGLFELLATEREAGTAAGEGRSRLVDFVAQRRESWLVDRAAHPFERPALQLLPPPRPKKTASPRAAKKARTPPPPTWTTAGLRRKARRVRRALSG
jgi:hypothetical protein